MATSKKNVAFWIESEMIARLEQRCYELGISKSTYLRDLVLADLGAQTQIRGNKNLEMKIVKAPRKKESPSDYFQVDEKKEAEWRRKKASYNETARAERPTAIF